MNISKFVKQLILFQFILLLGACEGTPLIPGLNLKNLLLISFSVLALIFAGSWGYFLYQSRKQGAQWRWPRPVELLIGAITDFFDTLGIGSFAPTTAFFRLGKLVPDELIPGTLNVGHTLPTVVQALIFIKLVPVATDTLIPMILAAGLGAWLGTGIVGRLPRLQIRLTMGVALLIAASIMLLSLLGVLPTGDDALGLTGWKWFVGVGANFILGLLMPLGIGLYAPCMILVSVLGMSPLAAFPIMMGSCAFLMPISSWRFCRDGKYLPSAALGIAFAGVPAVLLAAYVVEKLPLDYVRWIVVVVVLVVATGMLRGAWHERN